MCFIIWLLHHIMSVWPTSHKITTLHLAHGFPSILFSTNKSFNIWKLYLLSMFNHICFLTKCEWSTLVIFHEFYKLSWWLFWVYILLKQGCTTYYAYLPDYFNLIVTGQIIDKFTNIFLIDTLHFINKQSWNEPSELFYMKSTLTLPKL